MKNCGQRVLKSGNLGLRVRFKVKHSTFIYANLLINIPKVRRFTAGGIYS